MANRRTRRRKLEVVRSVPIRYLKQGDTIIDSRDKEVEVEDVKKVGGHWVVKYNGREHFYGERSKIERAEEN